MTIPDDANRQNVQFNQDGSIEPFEPGFALCVMSIIPAHKPTRVLRTLSVGPDNAMHWN